MKIHKDSRDRWQEIILEAIGAKPRRKVLTVCLPPPPEYRFVQTPRTWIVIYEN